ncbi:MAG: serine hydrolase, partial [Sphingobacteriales bacterium]
MPKNLEPITRQQDEQPAEQGGMTTAQVNRIWRSVEGLYKTGNYPMVSICLRRQGQI